MAITDMVPNAERDYLMGRRAFGAALSQPTVPVGRDQRFAQLQDKARHLLESGGILRVSELQELLALSILASG